MYDLAKRLQPSSMQALAAIRDTVAMEARQQGAPAGMTPPMTPRPGAPRTPFPFPFTAAPGTPAAKAAPKAKVAPKAKAPGRARSSAEPPQTTPDGV